jgi:hypothetical protein
MTIHPRYEARRLYKHYESSTDVFVDREEHIEWMNKALERCKDECAILRLKLFDERLNLCYDSLDVSYRFLK